MRSVMQHQFSQVPSVNIPRSVFNRSHGYKTTFDAGYLIPVFCDEALPGDTFNLRMTGFSRVLSPMIVPLMDNLIMDTQFFAVPIRLLWDNWQHFNGEQDNPGDPIDYVVPTFQSGVTTVASLQDYMGLPVGVDVECSAFWQRAYNLIYNEWYRDQNLQDSVVVDKDDGPDDPADYVLLRRGKRHDYFTSCLPWPQKGESVSLPLGTVAPITGIGAANQTYTAGPLNVFETGGTGSTDYADYKPTATGGIHVEEDPNNPGFPGIFADLSTATAATINELRQAFQIQRLLERDARGGSRYTEILRSHFGVISPDSRVQRPEYLGGGSTAIQVHPVASTAQTSTGIVGDLASFATGTATNHGFTKSFTEHCVLIGLLSVRADLSYQQGLNRMFSRQTRYDFYWPSLSHIGEQAVLNKEIFADGSATDSEVFGYQERYAEYRYKPSLITGDLRSTVPLTLDVYHLAQEFGSLPTLSSAFIVEDPPLDRVLTVPGQRHFVLDTYFDMRCARPMPLYGVPGLIDHF